MVQHTQEESIKSSKTKGWQKEEIKCYTFFSNKHVTQVAHTVVCSRKKIASHEIKIIKMRKEKW